MTPDEQERLVGELEIALDRLQALYNQYFMGIEKLEPLVQRKEVERKINALRKQQIRNTAIRFRMQTQIQKYNTQSTYWRRICRQIEEGTYRRDVMRAKRRAEVRDEQGVAAQALAKLSDEPASEQPPTHDLSAMGLDLDDPFAETNVQGSEPAHGLDDLDDPFAEPAPPARSAKPTPRKIAAIPVPDSDFAKDLDKTPVPVTGSGVHVLHEKLVERTKQAEDVDTEKLTDFFVGHSTPPPTPTTDVKSRPQPVPQRARVASRGRAESPKPSVGGPSAKRIQTIYQAYITARKKCNENPNIPFEKVAEVLKKRLNHSSEIKDFKVVIRGGKAVIKTVKS